MPSPLYIPLSTEDLLKLLNEEGSQYAMEFENLIVFVETEDGVRPVKSFTIFAIGATMFADKSDLDSLFSHGGPTKKPEGMERGLEELDPEDEDAPLPEEEPEEERGWAPMDFLSFFEGDVTTMTAEPPEEGDEEGEGDEDAGEQDEEEAEEKPKKTRKRRRKRRRRKRPEAEKGDEAEEAPEEAEQEDEEEQE